MNNTKNEIYFNFSYYALKLLGKGLYSNPWTAIAELVANGLDANATQVKILIDMSNKEQSTIEIFDNGFGMNYKDLAEKYVLIGNNKRNDKNLNEYLKNKVMGRKGIGKLAALYLTNKYYIISKTKEESSAWIFDARNSGDSDIPSLKRIKLDNINIVSAKIWNKFLCGTMIKLENVDMSDIGIKTLEGLRARLSDYYLYNTLQSRIEFSILWSKNEKINFIPIKKEIAFKNFYAIFNNSKDNISSFILKKMTFPSKYIEVSEKERSTVKLNHNSFVTEGEAFYIKDNGERIKYKYNLSGWIGIHASILKAEAQKNDPLFFKNKVYKSTQLRLYVRKKLAVEDFMPYLNNTQAFSNYIEGEISFDILDDNLLPDIATSNRQGFIESDDRIIKLIELLKPIINKLIQKRLEIAKQIKTEENTIEHQKQIDYENSIKYIEEKYKSAIEQAQKYHRQSNIIFNSISDDQRKFAERTHLIKTNIDVIRNCIVNLTQKIGIKGHEEINTILMTIDKIISVINYGALAKYNIENVFITQDLFLFIDEYLNNVLKLQYIDIDISVQYVGNCVITFNPQEIAAIFDNLISNSKKSASKKFVVKMSQNQNLVKISIIDDGKGISIKENERIFEYGYSNTFGTGIGLYNIKHLVENMKGNISVDMNNKNGAKFDIYLHMEEKK